MRKGINVKEQSRKKNDDIGEIERGASTEDDWERLEQRQI